MTGAVRLLFVTILTVALIGLPSRAAFAAEADAAPAPHVVSHGPLLRSALAVVPPQARLMRQVVATTNESKILLGLVSAGAAVGGLGMLAYGSSSSCKGKPGNDTKTCERLAVIGAVSLGAGVAALALWALSR